MERWLRQWRLIRRSTSGLRRVEMTLTSTVRRSGRTTSSSGASRCRAVHMFELDVITTYRPFLHHLSSRGEFYLTSDSVMPTWIHWKRTAELIPLIPASELEQFRTIAHQIGGKLVFPGKQIDRKPTINQERVGTKIADRLDLTLECIRLHYLGEDQPLG